jgi:HK97 family phage portal protein
MPRGGVQTSLVGMINALTAPFRRESGPNGSNGGAPAPFQGKSLPLARTGGAPIYSHSWGQNGGGPNGGGNTPRSPADITQFAPVFQPSGGLFAPGYPLVPVERERLRIFNFPVGVNYIYTPRSFETIGFPELKALARDDITRLCIETRKDQVEKLTWTIKPRNEKDPARNAPARIQQLTEFWQYPDRRVPFATWLRTLMDQILVADCPALEPRRNRGGDVIGFDVIDGSTIKVLIDDTGRRPQPPAPAFQQIVHGRPWVMLADGGRSNVDEGEIYNEFTDQELIYFPRNPRADHLYGFSPVEQIVLTINTSIRRGVMQLQHFTEGNVPAGMVNSPAGWTPEQIAGFQEFFDSKYAGNTAERTKLLWGPEGAKYQAIKQPPVKDDFDEWRARVICFAFSLPPTAFTRQVNRATAETAQEAALEEGLAPLMGYVKRLIDGIIRMQGHPDLEFAWSDQKPIDPTDQADMLVNLTGNGLMTVNEGRDQLGLEPVEGGDEILFKTATGPVTLDSVLNPPEPPPMVVPGEAAPGEAPGSKGKNPPAEAGGKPGKPGKPGKNSPPGKRTPAADAEGGKPPKGESTGPGGKPKGEVGKTADSPFAKTTRVSRRNTALLEQSRTRLQRKLEPFFAARAEDVARQLAREMRLEGWEKL